MSKGQSNEVESFAGSINNITTKAKSKKNTAKLAADNPMLSEVVTLSRQFQRAVRLDADFGSIEALRGYICQGTARNVLESTARQIVHSTQRAFTWTGPFGGGKSSLAVALCSLVAKNESVRNAAFDVLDVGANEESDIPLAFSATKKGWLILPVVGHRGSVIDAIATSVDSHSGAKILSETKSGSRQRVTLLLKTLAAEAAARVSDGVLLVIDELGKFLEAAASDGDDVYFYQELADLAGRSAGKLVVVGILHQSFEQYAHRLGSELRDEWRKVQGRYVDIPLVAATDEVVELTGRAIQSDFPHPESMVVCKQVANSIRHHRPSLSAKFADRLDLCWPLHPVTAALLGPISKRRFGQNERSTFGFLASVEAYSLKEFLHSTPQSSKQTYTPAAYWDYLRTNFEPSILASPDSHRWSQSVEAVERVEQKQLDGTLHLQLIKTIALIDLFRHGSGIVCDDAVLGACLINCEGVVVSRSQVQELLQDLRRWAVVVYKRHLGSWCIAEGSDFDLDEALNKALSTIDEPDLAQLSKLVHLRPVLAKRHYCNTGTLRWMLPLMAHANSFQDGIERAYKACGISQQVLSSTSAFGAFLLVIPARGQSLRQTINTIKNIDFPSDTLRPVLVGVPRNGESIREFGRELMAYDQISRQHSELENDAVARRELFARTTDVRSRLEEELRDALNNIQWVNADRLGIQSKSTLTIGTSLPVLASEFADRVFSKCPLLFSELINRDVPSSNSAKARKDLLYVMLRNRDKPRLGLEGYPAEAGLYHNILEASGLHRQVHDGESCSEQVKYCFAAPIDGDPRALRASSFIALWEQAVDLVVNADSPISLVELYKLWQYPPFGVRSGVLPVLWLAFYLANQNRIAIYKDGMFISDLDEVNIDETLQDPGRFTLRYVRIDDHKREILVGIAEHLRRLGHAVEVEPLEAARGLVSLVYGLSPWARRTQLLSESTKAVRDTLARASDPHKVLFVDLPILFDGLSVAEYVKAIGDALDEMQLAYTKMLSDVLSSTLDSISASLENEEEVVALHHRSNTVIGISGNLQLDAFATRLSSLNLNPDSVDSLLSMAVQKPPRDWTDSDIDAALIQLAQWGLQFRQVEAVCSVRDRVPTRNAIAIVLGTGQKGKTVSESFDVSPSENRLIQKISTEIMKNFKDVSREVFLAALAQTATRLVESEQKSEELV
ncbi:MULTISPECIES: ATP-binding protein [Pseudomonas]|uniref:ATP-binding protein n=1 Tax=Pseudomonas TaxID=286 RepID=UPI0013CEAEF5|nr:ATP-binding protein [Pseudomonas viridiflava]